MALLTLLIVIWLMFWLAKKGRRARQLKALKQQSAVAGAGKGRRRRKQQALTQEDLDIIENVAIIQPIIQDTHKH